MHKSTLFAFKGAVLQEMSTYARLLFGTARFKRYRAANVHVSKCAASVQCFHEKDEQERVMSSSEQGNSERAIRLSVQFGISVLYA